jgi:hypothetical protein
MQIDQNDLYPYLLVNIGSGVGMIKVLIIQDTKFLYSSNFEILIFFLNNSRNLLIFSIQKNRWKEMESLSELVEQV